MKTQLTNLIKRKFSNTYFYLTTRKVYHRILSFHSTHFGRKFYLVKSIEGFINNSNGDQILQQVPEQRVEIIRPAYWDKSGRYNAAVKKNGKTNPVYVSLLNNCEVIGANSIIIRRNSALLDDFFLPNAERNDFTKYFWGIFSIKGNRIQMTFAKVSVNVETCIYLGGCASHNYYHWILEFISKLLIFESANIPRHIPIMVDAAVYESKQLSDVLSCFTERNIIVIARGKRCLVKHLYWANSFLWITHDLKPNLELCPDDSIIADEPILFLRKKVIEKLLPVLFEKSSLKNNTLIFISKRVVYHRKYNEEEVLAFLRPLGFQVVYPEDFSFAEQVSIFQNAKFIIGAAGAWMTNILFGNNDMIVLYFSISTNESLFSALCQGTQIELQKFLVQPNSTGVHSDFTVDVATLKEVVRNVISSHSYLSNHEQNL